MITECLVGKEILTLYTAVNFKHSGFSSFIDTYVYNFEQILELYVFFICKYTYYDVHSFERIWENTEKIWEN